jgi:hypothetical protein
MTVTSAVKTDGKGRKQVTKDGLSWMKETLDFSLFSLYSFGKKSHRNIFTHFHQHCLYCEVSHLVAF